MAKEKQLTLFLREGENGNVKDDMLVHVTIYSVPASLVDRSIRKLVECSY